MKKITFLLFALCMGVLSWQGTAQVPIGVQDGTTSELPIHGLYVYSYSQQIVYQSEINADGDITSISFYYSSGSTENGDDWNVYLGHTTKTDFTSNTDWVAGADLTQVFSGTVTYPQPGGFMQVTFDTPFPYNNTDNLVVAVTENRPGWDTINFGKTETVADSNRGIYWSSDSQMADINAPATAKGRKNFINNMILGGIQQSCPFPNDLVATDITQTSATLEWTQTGSATTWEVIYGEQGFDPEATGTTISVSTDPSTLLTGLSTNTVYDFYVKAICSATDESNFAGPSTFRTACDIISNLPYFENFDTYGTGSDAFPACWERPVTNETSTVWPSIVSRSGAPSSPNALKFQSIVGTPTYAVSPPFEEDIDNLSVSFFLKREGTSSGTIDLGVMSDANDISTFELVETIDPSSNDFIEYSFNLNGVTLSGGNNFIALRHNTNSNIYYYWVDDFKVDVIPTCIQPTDLTVDNADFNSIAEISWTAGDSETSWNVSWGPVGYTPGDADEIGTDTVTVTNYEINDLLAGNYDVYVQADCGSDDLSSWAGPLFVNTGYCVPTGSTNNGDEIRNFTLGNLNNDSAASEGTNGYSDYTSSVAPADLEAGESYTASLTSGTGSGSHGAAIWIDYDLNGTFDSSEMVASIDRSITASSTVDFPEFTIPAGTPDGRYTLRVQYHYNKDGDELDPCVATSQYSETEDYAIVIGDEDGGGDDDEDCGQGDDSNDFENAFNITDGGSFRNADDFIVSANNTLNIQSIELNIFANAPITSLNINFYSDDNGAPGTLISQSVTDAVPYAQVQVGSNFGYNVYAVFVEVDLDFEGGANGATYWMQPSAEAATAFWEVTTEGTLGAPIHTSEAQGAWVADEDGASAVFKLHCDVATPPDYQCMFNITSSVEPITRFVMADVDNASSASSTEVLEDFTDIMINATAGSSYDVALEGNTSGGFTNYFTIFVDTSEDGNWSSFETFEIGSINSSTGEDGQQATATITLPGDLEEGNYTLRIVKNFNTSPLDPCGSYSYGQGEDYTLVIGELEDCSGTPEAGVASVNPESGNINTTYVVSATDYTFGNGMTYQWQSNTDGAGWVDEGAATNSYASYTATAAAENGVVTEWRLEVTCTFSGETSYSETATFTTEKVYCTPVMDCADGDVITNVTFQEIDNATSCSPNGYGDYTDMVAMVQSGGTYEIAVTVGDGFVNESVSVWIDFDNSGTFDEDEFFYIGTGSSEELTGNIAIPADAADGDYRMRVRVAAVGAASATWDMACDEEQVFGETEDYTVTVSGVVGTDDFANIDFTYYPNPMQDVLYITGNKTIESISAYNVLGQEVINSMKYTDGKVDVSSLPTGTFMFKVTFENGQVENFKVMKK